MTHAGGLRDVLDSAGRPIPLGPLIGRGGEGAVYDVAGRPEIVAKIYTRPDHERIDKLQAMVRIRSDRLERISAWPIDLLHDRAGKSAVGFLMPRITGYHDIHLLYGPKTRLDMFPEARWRFLVRAAGNVARAFRVVHECGLAIGDVNHGNLLVSPRATVRLIDCDSFQVTADGRTYHCKVGVETHTPPELQGRNLASGVYRTANHDAFGLAIVIFQLLFMGRHPYAGTYLGSEHMPIGRAISEGRFVYGTRGAQARMQPPPHSLPLAAGSPRVAALFEQAFSSRGSAAIQRPAAGDWVAALEALEKGLKTCTRDASHQYAGELTSCPWCHLEQTAVRIGVVIPLFHPYVQRSERTQSFDLDKVWALIEAVAGPGSIISVQPSIPFAALTPSPEAEREGQERRRRRRLMIGSGLVGVILVVVLMQIGIGGLGLGLVAVAGAAFLTTAILYSTTPDRVGKEAAARLFAAETEIADLRRQMNARAGERAFLTLKEELRSQREAHRSLGQRRQQRLQDLVRHAEQAQRTRFLERHRIWQARIPGIGPERSASLQSFGIETAADITADAVSRVPGFGPVLTNTLLSWRHGIERQFRFDSRRSIDPADIRAVERGIQVEQYRLERELTSGAERLQRVAQQTRDLRASLRASIEAAERDRAQAMADIAAAR